MLTKQVLHYLPNSQIGGHIQYEVEIDSIGLSILIFFKICCPHKLWWSIILQFPQFMAWQPFLWSLAANGHSRGKEDRRPREGSRSRSRRKTSGGSWQRRVGERDPGKADKCSKGTKAEEGRGQVDERAQGAGEGKEEQLEKSIVTERNNRVGSIGAGKRMTSPPSPDPVSHGTQTGYKALRVNSPPPTLLEL